MRGFAVAEVLVAAGAIAGVPAAGWAVAGAFAGFAGVVALLLRRGLREISCGCFGTTAVPLSVLHVIFDAGLAILAALRAASGPAAASSVVAESARLGPVVIVGWLLVCYLCALVFVRMPLARAPRRPRGV